MKFYRYDYESNSKDLDLTIYSLIKETPKGYWIKENDNWAQYKLKWVSKTAKKRLAYPTQEEALHSFIKRKELRLIYLENDLYFTKESLEIANNLFDKMESQCSLQSQSS